MTIEPASEPLPERAALAYVLGLLAGQRDNPDSPPMLAAAAAAALAGLLPRARELGLELDDEHWQRLEGR